MWVEPIADVCNIQAILDYALTANGYDYAVREFRRYCGDVANERLGVFEKAESGKAPSKN